MGDFQAQRKRDVIDRLKRRVDLYRQHQSGCYERFGYAQNHITDEQKRQTFLLRQKWMESKAKKASKSKKSDNSHPDHRNPALTNRLKRKIDNHLEQSHLAENTYRFEDESPPTKKGGSEGGAINRVSVNVQISGGSALETNVTVVQSGHEKGDQSGSVKTNVECKREPLDSTSCVGQGQGNEASSNQKSNDISKDLEEILRGFENSNHDIPQEIIDELDRFDEICKNVHDSETKDDAALNPDMFGPSPTGSPGTLQGSPGNMNMYMDTNNMGPVRTPPIQQQYRGQPHQPGVSLSETGPAAETLKQMAAQHQHQSYGVKGSTNVEHFPDTLADTAQYPQRNGYPPDYKQSQAYPGVPRSTNSGYPQGQGHPNMSDMRNSMAYAQTKQGYPYGTTKPLTHYSQPHVPNSQSDSQPSSLQQLQNQVAHFNQAPPPPHMEITQTQHMQVSDGAHRMQMSQTQHVQMRQPVQQISLTQHQSFSVSAPGIGESQSPSFMPNDQMNMPQQHMTPDQRQHMTPEQRQHMPSDQRQHMTPEQRQQHMTAEQRQQQYMSRPPPEYKMQHANGIPGPMQGGNLGPNHLQTIQNMVNQTSSVPNTGFDVKSEPNSMHMQNGMMQTAMHQQQMAASVGTVMSRDPDAHSSYPVGSVQRQASFPGAHPHARTQRPNASAYTSAIMRNQRPPNVNIGPDGLNISQPRAVSEWQQARFQAPRVGGPGVTRPTMEMSAAAGMMQYRSYSSDGSSMNAAAAAAQMHMQQTRPMQMSAMQSQAAMMQSSAQTQMMMQQQRMQMSHQMGARPSHPYGMAAAQGMAGTMGGSFPQSSASQDEIMNLLDNTSQSADFFDVQTSGGSTDPNWMVDIDEILGTSK